MKNSSYAITLEIIIILMITMCNYGTVLQQKKFTWTAQSCNNNIKFSTTIN